MIRRTLAVVVFLVGCSSAPAAPIHLKIHDGDPGPVTLPTASYLVSWSAPGCTFFDLRWAPTSGAAETIIVSAGVDGTPDPSNLPGGSRTLELGGTGYFNRGGNCPGYVVDVSTAVSGSGSG